MNAIKDSIKSGRTVVGTTGSPKRPTSTLAPTAVQVLVSWPGKRQCIRPRSRGGLTTPHIAMLSLKTLSPGAPRADL